MNLNINLNFKTKMKTLEDLKAFSLDKKQMNEATGGANTGCDYVVGLANKHGSKWSQAELDAWAELYDMNCL